MRAGLCKHWPLSKVDTSSTFRKYVISNWFIRKFRCQSWTSDNHHRNCVYLRLICHNHSSLSVSGVDENFIGVDDGLFVVATVRKNLICFESNHGWPIYPDILLGIPRRLRYWGRKGFLRTTLQENKSRAYSEFRPRVLCDGIDLPSRPYPKQAVLACIILAHFPSEPSEHADADSRGTQYCSDDCSGRFLYLVLSSGKILTLHQFIIGIFLCVPVQGFWDHSIPSRCVNFNALFNTNESITIVLDLVVLLLPVWFIAHLH